jgi:uncharacterized membrane protein YkvA (DUF1232 family)
MLFKRVNAVAATIEKLPFFPAPPQLAEQIRANAPNAVSEVTRQARAGGMPGTDQQSLQVLSLIAHTAIKSIPRATRAMAEKVKDRRVPVAQRCAIACILAYFVQPHDLIPDNAPGQYGYMDDAILLQAGMVEYLDTLPQGMDSRTQQMTAALLIGLTPEQVRPQLEMGISTLSATVQILAMIGAETQDLLDFVIANPLAQAPNMSAPRGFNPHPPREYGGFFGSSGAYIEGNNFILPGGGGLINGEVIPNF